MFRRNRDSLTKPAASILRGTALLFALVVFGSDAGAQQLPPGAEDCALCHEPHAPTRPRASGAAPPFNAPALLRSVHARLSCTDCHADLEGADFPHEEKLAPAACGHCHDDVVEQFADCLHGRGSRRGDPLAPSCATCHGTHGIRRGRDPDSPTNVMNIPSLCGGCHREGTEVSLTRHLPQDSIFNYYSESIHGEGLFKKGLVVTAVCTSCHTAHHILPHTNPKSSISPERIAETCLQCHARIEEVHRKVIRGELWEEQPHMIPACVDCHSPHKIRKVFYNQGMADRDCLRCHGSPAGVQTAGGVREELLVDVEELAGSRHVRVACVQCHTECSPALERPCTTVREKVDCSICHAAVVEEYGRSTHGSLALKGSPDAPTCHDCHGSHGVLSKHDSKAKIFARNIPALCGECHRMGHKAAVRRAIGEMEVVERYTESIHGKGLLESGLTVTATCANCHTAHGELPAANPASTVNRNNISQTCAKCHRGIYEQFEESVHSPKVTQTTKKQPVCSDCHSAHSIRRVDVSDFRLHIMDQCGDCHYEIAKSYFDTYHGKVSKLGYVKTAKCYDCHGSHNILPTWNPRSLLSRNRIVETCGQCHPGSNRRFAGYLTHSTHHDPEKYPVLYYTFWGMTILLVSTLSLAGLHTLAWLPRSLQFRRQLKQMHVAEATVYVRRFKPFYSRLHLMVIVSFFALALTGMILKFSYTTWARVLARLLGGFETAGGIHRLAAVVTFAYFGLHIWDLLFRKRKEVGGLKKLVFGHNRMLPTLTDLKEVGGSLRWFFGRGPRPEYGRWTYWEKFDYFAVFWGVAVIGISGLLLWFPEFFTRLLPGHILNVAAIVHSDEALLAVGFIFTIHFFNTHFRPEKFPMDPVIFTGRVPLEEFKIDRPREYAELVASGKLEEHLASPPNEKEVRFWRIFGLSALGVGLTLIGLIVYAVLFAYR